MSDDDNDDEPPPPPLAGSTAAAPTSAKSFLGPYVRVVKTNVDFRILWLSNVFSELGNWFNFVASLTVLNNATGGSTLAIAAFLVVEAVPPVFLGPLFGVLVDRYDKKRLLQLSSLCRALIVPALIFTQSADTLPLMFVITFFKFVFSSLYVPARSAIVPFIVPKEDLVIANGLDGVIFSCMHFIGGAFGGLMTTFLGITGAFIADSVCFFVTMYVTAFLFNTGRGWLAPFTDLAAAVRSCGCFGGAGGSSVAPKYNRVVSSDELAMVTVNDEGDDDDLPGAASAVQHVNAPAEDEDKLAQRLENDDSTADSADQLVLKAAVVVGDDDALLSEPVQPQNPTPSSIDPQRRAAIEKELGEYLEYTINPEDGTKVKKPSHRMFIDGFRFIFRTPYVAAICCFRGSSWLALGMINLMNIHAAQTIFAIGDDGSISVGLNYVIVGLGMLTTPIIARRYGSTTAHACKIILLLGMLQLTLGTWFLSFAYTYPLFLVANGVRSGSTSVVHIYQSLVLQQATPASLRGRVFTFEMIITTIMACSSQFLSGYLMDNLEWSVFEVDRLAAGICTGLLLLWSVYFYFNSAQVRQAYEKTQVEDELARK